MLQRDVTQVSICQHCHSNAVGRFIAFLSPIYHDRYKERETLSSVASRTNKDIIEHFLSFSKLKLSLSFFVYISTSLLLYTFQKIRAISSSRVRQSIFHIHQNTRVCNTFSRNTALYPSCPFDKKFIPLRSNVLKLLTHTKAPCILDDTT